MRLNARHLRWLAVFVAVALVVVLTKPWRMVRSQSSPIGKPMPDFSLQDLSGNVHSIREWQGQTLVINFWASWCPPCREEMPWFDDVRRSLVGEGVEVLGIALESITQAKSFAGKIGISYPVFAGYRNAVQASFVLGNFSAGVPYTVIVDRHGIIRYTKLGSVKEDELRDFLDKIL